MEERTARSDERPNFIDEYNKADVVGEPMASGLDAVSTPMQPGWNQYTDSTPSTEKWAEDEFREDTITTNYPEP